MFDSSTYILFGILLGISTILILIAIAISIMSIGKEKYIEKSLEDIRSKVLDLDYLISEFIKKI